MSVTIDQIGKIVHHCGAIELLINRQLIQLSKDKLLSATTSLTEKCASTS